MGLMVKREKGESASLAGPLQMGETGSALIKVARTRQSDSRDTGRGGCCLDLMRWKKGRWNIESAVPSIFYAANDDEEQI